VAERYTVSGFADVSDVCAQRDIKLTKLKTYNITLDDIQENENGLLIVNGWNRLIRPEIIETFRYGGLGIHAGHPPIGLGRAPLPWNIIKNFNDIEVYVFKLTKNADDGDIVASQVVEITPFDDIRMLYEKVMYTGSRLFEKAIPKVLDGAPDAIVQSRQHIITYQKRTPDDGYIDFRSSVDEIYNSIRAQTHPYPGAFSFLDGKKWKIWKAVPFDCYAFRELNRIPGRILAALPAGIVVQTASSPLWILNATCKNEVVIPNKLNTMEGMVGKVFAKNKIRLERV
jgi:methionyl-tRNA formyltransferase